MNPISLATTAGFLLATLLASCADVTYVDATSGASGNTTHADGSAFSPPLNGATGADNQWEERTVFGSGGNVFESGGENVTEDAPELKTTVGGLIPGATYTVHSYFWDPASTGEDWNLRAGPASNPGGSQLYCAADATAELAGSAAVLASTLTHSTAPSLFTEGGRNLLAAPLGLLVADGTGKISVVLNDLPTSLNVNRRTWYDGIGYELSAPPVNAVTYVDATTANTTRWDGQPFSPAPNGTTGLDDNWETRLLGNNTNVLESNMEAAENAPVLVTSVTGLAPNTSYVVHAYYWDAATGNWRVKASVKATDVQNNGTPADASDDFLPTLPSTHFASDDNAGGTATAGSPASATAFVSTPLTVEADRTLRQANLGLATTDATGKLSVYIDDLAFMPQDKRTWFDGIGYKLAMPLSPAADEDGDGLSNGDETTNGTNPYIVDTDGDSFGDGAEIIAGSDPLNPNSVPPLPGNALAIAPDGAWTWFNDERTIFHQGSIFCGYVKANGQYGVTRYDPATNTSHHMLVSTATSQQQDDHNNPSITPLPDGKLMILYAKHLSEPRFYQRISLVPLPSSDADWGPETVRVLAANNTYNNTYVLAAESNRIYNFHRNINFNPTISISNDLGATWQSPIPFIEVGTGGVRPYPRYCSNRSDRVDLIYTDGHPRDVENSIYHMYYRIGGFFKTDGTLIDTFANLPLDHGGGQRGSVVYQFSNSNWGVNQGPDDWIPTGRGWTWDVHYGSDGKPVCVFQVQVDNVTGTGWNNDRIYYYYARWTGTAWQKRFIAQAGRPLYSSEDDYGGGMTIDPSNPNVIYISSNAADPFNLSDLANVPLRAGERYEIWRGVTDDGGLTFHWEQITQNSASDNLRPIVPENHGYDRTLVWFNGTYSSYTNFNARVLAIFKNKPRIKSFSFSPSTNSGTLSWASSPGWFYRITGSPDLSGFSHEVVSEIESQGDTTSRNFTFPGPLQNQQKAFFRVEEK